MMKYSSQIQKMLSTSYIFWKNKMNSRNKFYGQISLLGDQTTHLWLQHFQFVNSYFSKDYKLANITVIYFWKMSQEITIVNINIQYYYLLRIPLHYHKSCFPIWCKKQKSYLKWMKTKIPYNAPKTWNRHDLENNSAKCLAKES